MSADARPVVAGVDGTALGRNAALWAGRYADAFALPLQIAYAGDVPEDLVEGQAADASDDMLVALVSWLRHNAVEAPIEATVRSQSAESLLDTLSPRAALVVTGDRGDGLFGSLVRGSVGHFVAGHARCPVVLVPPTWQDRPLHPVVVTVGVSSSASGERALDFALRFAAARHGRVAAVRCWDDEAGRPGSDPALEEHLQARVTHALVTQSRRRTGLDRAAVEVAVELRRGPVPITLRAAAAGSDLLVLGCRYRTGGWTSRLGPTTSRLSRRLTCPVAVVDVMVPDHPAAPRVVPAGHGRSGP